METCNYCKTRPSWVIRCGCGITCRTQCACAKHISKGARAVLTACKDPFYGVRLKAYEESE